MAENERDLVADATPQVCFNLWAFCDPDTGLVMEIAAKRYVMGGSDREKAAVLKHLAGADFYSVERRFVPERFTLVGPSGQLIEGAVPVNDLDVDAVFAPLIVELAAIPKQVRQVNGRWEEYVPQVLGQPIWVLTVVLETEDGRLVPC
ncbi:hypothetical protein [Mycolicibacterium fallax]|uniref:Uncharacterized protein n=1 Tax=Mycolicibacterium fallax TaxID=1793 RepID=A0A1X1RJE8_MYCFA|nr:hypothetical protein [Mycolicibacterium fallax]ORV07659.1 hypothetical protein AWC04_02865 [Mycolicibacterium fallax]BBY99291.1 hypothetical protein MFAL_27580 [Mycolicibacterium fallax]HOW95982.1 hypothetical protein [Mycolicibacterium fallax]